MTHFELVIHDLKRLSLLFRPTASSDASAHSTVSALFGAMLAVPTGLARIARIGTNAGGEGGTRRDDDEY